MRCWTGRRFAVQHLQAVLHLLAQRFHLLQQYHFGSGNQLPGHACVQMLDGVRQLANVRLGNVLQTLEAGRVQLLGAHLQNG